MLLKKINQRCKAFTHRFDVAKLDEGAEHPAIVLFVIITFALVEMSTTPSTIPSATPAVAPVITVSSPSAINTGRSIVVTHRGWMEYFVHLCNKCRYLQS